MLVEAAIGHGNLDQHLQKPVFLGFTQLGMNSPREFMQRHRVVGMRPRLTKQRFRFMLFQEEMYPEEIQQYLFVRLILNEVGPGHLDEQGSDRYPDAFLVRV